MELAVQHHIECRKVYHKKDERYYGVFIFLSKPVKCHAQISRIEHDEHSASYEQFSKTCIH